MRRSRKDPGNRISNVSGQVVIGEGNTAIQRSTVDASSAVPDLAALHAQLLGLRNLVDAEAGGQAGRARARVDDLEEALTTGPPDITTLAYVRDWFRRHVPELAGAVASLIVHPAVTALVTAAGEEALREFRVHFGQPPH